MLNFLKDYFTFSRGERNGIMVLLMIIISLMLLPQFLEIFKRQRYIDFNRFHSEIAEFEKQQALALASKSQRDTAASSALQLFNFNPNEISAEDWKKLGVSGKTTNTIMNYLSKGGHFYEKDDLLKIYGFDTATYEALAPYIVLKEEEKPEYDPFDKAVLRKEEKKPFQKEHFSYEKKSEYKPKENVVVELNSADTTELVKVRGIGPTLSKRIIKYRDKLGGFLHVNQLTEVYGMDSAWFEIMKPSLRVDSTLISKIPINSAVQEELEKHPYLGRNAAKAIVNYRQQHGHYSSVDDLKKVYVIDEKLLAKIKPYVSLD